MNKVVFEESLPRLAGGYQIDARSAIAQAVREVLNFDHVARASMDTLRHRFQGAEVAISLSRFPGYRLLPIWVSGNGELASQFLCQQGLLWQISQDAFEGKVATSSENVHVRLIKVDDVAMGVTILRGGDQQMLDLAESISTELARAASQLEEIADVQRLRRELEILNQIGKSLTSHLELDGILVATMQGIWELFRVEVAAITLLDFDQQDVLIKIPLTGGSGNILRYNAKAVKGILGDCIFQQATALVEDVSQNPRFDPEIDGVDGYVSRSLLCVPLLVRARSMGAISLINKLDDPFDKRDLDLLVTFAASVAGAIANAHLIHEITAANRDLKESRQEIERSRSTLLALFDNLDDELYIIDSSYTLIAVNRSRSERAGADPRQLVAKRCYKILEGRSKPCPICRSQETFASGVKTKRTERVRGADGRAVVRDIYTYPIMNSEGKVSQTILQLRDVTEQRRLESSLVQAEKLAALGQLAAGVAHELYNPITAVIANTQLLQRELDPNAVDMESVELIERAGKRAQRVVRDLLDFARHEPEEFQIVEINTTIQSALSLVGTQWQRAQIKLVQELSPLALPVYGNSDHLQGVWINLLVNAHDALQGKPGMVTVRSRNEGTLVIVEIEDTGVGISPEDMNRIFEPFFTTKAPGKGTGLGLATSYRILERHQGTIEVDSSPKVGTCFTVKLPIASD